MIKSINIEVVPYFAYGSTPRKIFNDVVDNSEQRIKLSQDNIDELLDKLAKGENLFKLLDQEFFYIGEYGVFQRRTEGKIGEETFISEKGYTQVGRCLIPYDQVLTKNQIFSARRTVDNMSETRMGQLMAIDGMSDDKLFHMINDKYSFLDDNFSLVLREDQLKPYRK